MNRSEKADLLSRHTRYGFRALDAARERARERGVYISDLRDLEALRNELATRRA